MSSGESGETATSTTGEVTDQQTQQTRGRAVLVPLVITLLVFTSVGLLLPLTTITVVDRLREPKKYIGYAVVAFTTGAMCGRLIGGALIDSFGIRRGLRVAASVVACSGLVYVVPTSIPTFLLGRFLHGLGEAMVYTAAATLVVNTVAPTQRSRYLGLLGSAVWGGLSIGPTLVDTLNTTTRAGVLTAAAGGALFAASVLIPTKRNSVGETSKRRLKPSFPRPAIAPSVCVGFYNLGYAAISGFLILHMRAHDFSTKGALSYYGFAVLFGRLALGRLPDRLGPRPSLMIGISTMFVAMSVIAFAPSLLAMRAALIMFGVGYSMPFPALASISVDRTSEAERASTIATLGIVFDVFVAIASIGYGRMADAGWLQAVFFVAMGGIAIGLAMALRITNSAPGPAGVFAPAQLR